MREVAKAAGTATTGRPVPKPAWKQLVEKRHVQREDDEQAAELKIAQENQDQGDVEGLGYAYKVEEQPLYAALENFELAVKDVRSAGMLLQCSILSVQMHFPSPEPHSQTRLRHTGQRSLPSLAPCWAPLILLRARYGMPPPSMRAVQPVI